MIAVTVSGDAPSSNRPVSTILAHDPTVWRATVNDRCHLCGGDHACSATLSGLHRCWRTHAEGSPGWRWLGDDCLGFGMHRWDGDGAAPVRQRSRAARFAQMATSPARQAVRPADWQGLHDTLCEQDYRASRVEDLAVWLGVTVSSLLALGCAFAPGGEEARGIYAERFGVQSSGWPTCHVFPERDGEGRIVGLGQRLADGTKRSAAGGHRGLTIPDGWRHGQGPIWIVEGPTDTAAMLDMSLRTIGRPSNLGGAAHLARLFRDLPVGTEVIVVGENDERERDGERIWPGRDGAVRVSAQLAASCSHLRVSWCLPPDRAKDVRAWAKGEHGELLGVVWRDRLRSQELLVEVSAPAAPGACHECAIDTVGAFVTPSRTALIDQDRVAIARQLHPRTSHVAGPGACRRCSKTISLVSSDPTQSELQFMNLACGDWGRCEVCARRHSGLWARRLADVWEEELERGWAVYEMVDDPDLRPARIAAIRRATPRQEGLSRVDRALEVRWGVLTLPGSPGAEDKLIFALPADAALPTTLAGAIRCGRAHLAGTLDDWKYTIDHDGPGELPEGRATHRPVTTCRAWALVRTRKTGSWKLGGVYAIWTEEQLLAALRPLERDRVLRLFPVDLEELSEDVRPRDARWIWRCKVQPGMLAIARAALTLAEMDEPGFSPFSSG